jgi:DNA-binding winged helix-turn-helix (wHTH) protein
LSSTARSARFGPFTLRDDGLLFAGEEHVPLTPTEEAVLRLLVEARGRLVSKDELIGQVWRGRAIGDASLTRAIHTLRRRLAQVPGGEQALSTVYARGYRLALPVTLAPEPASPAASRPEPRRSGAHATGH